ncbi:MAG: hypothetical protein HQ480_00215 [Candidatus Pelagibacter sp.]|nr:hypothetical protein [Candidatus Pelagibacter sp.]
MNFNRFFIVIISVFINFSLLAQPSGYSYGKKITIDNTKVSGSGSHTNFPVLISLTDNDLRTTGNSGYVQSSNGYDIIFTSGNGSTTYSHEIEKYNASTGEFVAWVNELKNQIFTRYLPRIIRDDQVNELVLDLIKTI